MTAYDKEELITATGIYTIRAPHVGSDYILYASGTFDGCNVTLGYIDGFGSFTTFRNSSGENLSMTDSSGYFVVAPPSKDLAVDVTGLGTPNIRLDLSHRKG
jgi:hypothetical protein